MVKNKKLEKFQKTQKRHAIIPAFQNITNLKQKRIFLKNKSALNRLYLSFGNISLNLY